MSQCETLEENVLKRFGHNSHSSVTFQKSSKFLRFHTPSTLFMPVRKNWAGKCRVKHVLNEILYNFNAGFFFL